MAVAGGATSAYLVYLDANGVLIVRSQGMMQRSRCTPVAEAVRYVLGNEATFVAGSDVERVRAAVASAQQRAG